MKRGEQHFNYFQNWGYCIYRWDYIIARTAGNWSQWSIPIYRWKKTTRASVFHQKSLIQNLSPSACCTMIRSDECFWYQIPSPFSQYLCIVFKPLLNEWLKNKPATQSRDVQMNAIKKAPPFRRGREFMHWHYRLNNQIIISTIVCTDMKNDMALVQDNP